MSEARLHSATPWARYAAAKLPTHTLLDQYERGERTHVPRRTWL